MSSTTPHPEVKTKQVIEGNAPSPATAAAPATATTAAPTPTIDDDDFDDLLDEFQEEILSKPPAASTDPHPSTATTAELDQINEALREMGIEEPEAKAQLESLLGQLTGTSTNEDQPPADFKTIMEQTLSRVKISGATVDEQLKSEQAAKKNNMSDEEMLMSLLGSLGGAGGDEEGLAELLSEMMEQLSSKSVLYEPMKDLSDKYPAWLVENEAKLDAAEFATFSNQFEIVKTIVAKFEAPDYDDGNTVMRNEVSEHLELLQKSGDPPAALVGDMDKLGGLFGGGDGMPGMDGVPGMGDDFDMDDLPEELKKGLQDQTEQCNQQ